MTVVEDHRVLADALGATLSVDPRLEVLATVGTLEAAVEQVRRAPPDVVLMDVQLPDGDGLTGTKLLLQEQPEAKVLILSASTGVEVVSGAVSAGASGFIHKTEPLSRIVEAIVRVHEGAVLFDPGTLRQVSAHLRQRRPGTDLTPREREVLQLLAEAVATDEIAERLVVSPHTVRNHVRSILAKLGAHSRLEAITIAVREDLVEVSSR